jgi:hypothetical protein
LRAIAKGKELELFPYVHFLLKEETPHKWNGKACSACHDNYNHVKRCLILELKFKFCMYHIGCSMLTKRIKYDVKLYN